ncbi:hypothetical protein [Maribacter cobaltidurans]|uniref:Lipocalin-like domain-containing protein n=1 Tax=Maribacter cobaltidurans TaxID=1178778 RepID=A0A223V5E6_9FLAO|nr:hypothetical protein [Maribacter cobaltidurans]ASV30526.1 hypothetical protein CJ263_10055 [Maribacter cobaltidurans]
MKRFFWVMISILFISCNQDDGPVIQDTSLNGEWILQDISCFCGFDPEIDFSETRLFFDTENDKLTVFNDGDNQFFKQSGDYYYGGQNNILTFTDDTSYQFEIKGKQMSLVYLDNPNIADDEVAYFFVRP